MGFLSGVGDHLKRRLHLKTIGKEMLATLTDRIIPHGAAELAHAFMTQGSGYVPYGQASIPVAEAPASATDAPDATPSMAEQYQASLTMNAQAGDDGIPDQSLSL